MTERLIEIWKRITVWQKMAVILSFIMWIGISIGVIVSLNLPWWGTLVLLCLVWLGFVGVAFILTKPRSQNAI